MTVVSKRAAELPGLIDIAFEIGHGFILSRTALSIDDDSTFEASEKVARRLSIVEESASFGIGDLANFVERKFGEKSSQILDRELFKESSLKVYKWVAEKVSSDDRVAGLSFRHHMLVASLAPPQQRKWLAKALEGTDGIPWSVSQLRDAIKGSDDATAAELAFWLVIRCTDEGDRAALRLDMQKKGRICKDSDVYEREPKKPKEITARPKRKKPRGKSRG